MNNGSADNASQLVLNVDHPRHLTMQSLPETKLVYRESIREFTGPYIAKRVDGKEVVVDVGQSTGPRSFNIAQIKPWPLQDLRSSPLERPRLPILEGKSPLRNSPRSTGQRSSTLRIPAPNSLTMRSNGSSLDRSKEGIFEYF
jgi:hypothetical protein